MNTDITDGIHYLNKKSGRKFTLSEVNKRFLNARLRDHSLLAIKIVINDLDTGAIGDLAKELREQNIQRSQEGAGC